MSDILKFTEDTEHYKKYLDMCNSEAYQQLQRFYHRKTVFDITGIARQENPHSSFIAWLLNPYESHGMGDYPMKRFLETVCFAHNKYGCGYLNENNPTFTAYDSEKRKTTEEKLLFFGKSDEKATLIKKLMQGDYSIVSCKISREYGINENQKSRKSTQRIDIYIDMELEFMSFGNRRILIAVENKVKSGETNTQTDDYMNFILTDETTKIFDLCVPIFLYPATNTGLKDNISLSGKFPCKNELYLLLNYQYLLDGVILPCQTAYCESSVSNMLEDYVACLGKYIDDKEEQTEKDKKKGKSESNSSKYMVMAVGRKEKEWILQLWENYSDVLMTACAELAHTDGVEEFLIKSGNVSDEQFYRSVLSFVKSHLEDNANNDKRGKDQECIDLIDSALKTTNRLKYYVKQKYGTVWEFSSGSRGNKSLGALGYVLIKQYVKDNSGLSSDMIQKMRDSIKHRWLRSVVVTKDDLKGLSDVWLEKYKQTGCVVCKRFYEKDTDDGQRRQCPLVYSIPSKDTSGFLDAYDCPLNPNISNKDLRENRTLGCTCFYDFLDHFFVEDVNEEIRKQPWGQDDPNASMIFEKEDIRNKGINETFGAIHMGNTGDFIYVARYWGVPTLDKLIDVLDMGKYVSKDSDNDLKQLDFTIAEITK